MSGGETRHSSGSLAIAEFRGEGFRALVSSGGWRVALIRYAERLGFNRMNRLERHLLTDEAFLLLAGAAMLAVAEAGEEPRIVRMEPQKVYNVARNAWHAIALSKDACVAVVENDDTGESNTEYRYLEEPLRLKGNEDHGD
ncbi:hypothetical protein [Cohnella fermenti]|uniref:Cupin domain-containing protein n=1 Tax=Cohnella fermenti TaxID=2565925 RepID=A0A4S4BUI6_9BACL|nr:hypothetical protein [Cohnella fermenti]THF76579.1 hypothetical protein E6C55_18775 [Cohnella fermenti]